MNNERLAAAVIRMTELLVLRDRNWRRLALLVATLFLAGGGFIAIYANPSLFRDLRWEPLILLVTLAIPITVVLNTFEFVLSGRLVGTTLNFRMAMETTIVGGVANMLPIPGGVAVRMAVLKINGTSFKRSTLSILISTQIWLGVAFVYAGYFICISGSIVFGVSLLIAGIVVLLLSFIMSIRLFSDWQITSRLTVNKVGLVLIDAIRLFLCLQALSDAGGFVEASALTASSVIGSVVSVVPAGLGLREGMAALIAPLVGLSASSAFIATSLNRIIGLAATAPVALYLSLRRSA